MKQNDYYDVISQVQQCKIHEVTEVVTTKFARFDQKTLGSIISLEVQKRVKSSFHFHCVQRINDYFQRYVAEVQLGHTRILLKLAKEIDVPPALLARAILQSHYKYIGMKVSKEHMKEQLRDMSLIADNFLAKEVYQCVIHDRFYGPFPDCIRDAMGREYEDKLKRELTALGVSFIDEKEMQARGYDKTPDIKLEIPISIDGKGITWIESKASFGDNESHKGYSKDQFWAYYNRFGPGLVIYWFGFIDELDVNEDKGIMLRKNLPNNIVKLSLSNQCFV